MIAPATPSDPMPPARRAGARLHLGYSLSLEKPEAQGRLPNQGRIPGGRWRAVRDSNFQKAKLLTGRRRTPIRRFARGCSSLRGRPMSAGFRARPPHSAAVLETFWRRHWTSEQRRRRARQRKDGLTGRTKGVAKGRRSVTLPRRRSRVRTRCSAPTTAPKSQENFLGFGPLYSWRSRQQCHGSGSAREFPSAHSALRTCLSRTASTVLRAGRPGRGACSGPRLISF